MSVSVHSHTPDRDEPVPGSMSRAVNSFRGLRGSLAPIMLQPTFRSGIDKF